MKTCMDGDMWGMSWQHKGGRGCEEVHKSLLEASMLKAHTYTHTQKRLGSNQLKEGRQGRYELCKQKKKKKAQGSIQDPGVLGLAIWAYITQHCCRNLLQKREWLRNKKATCAVPVPLKYATYLPVAVEDIGKRGVGNWRGDTSLVRKSLPHVWYSDTEPLP